MSTIRAICEDGVFRPAGPVGLPERCVVEFDPKVVEPDAPESSRHTPCAVRRGGKDRRGNNCRLSLRESSVLSRGKRR